MKNSLEQIEEIIDNLIVICNEETSLPQIEKDILLAKLRQAYSKVMKIQVVDKEEFTLNTKPIEQPVVKEIKAAVAEVKPATPAPKPTPEIPKPIIPEPKVAPKPEVQQKIEVKPEPTVSKPVEEPADNEDAQSDFDLFFDPDQDKVKTSGTMEPHVINTDKPVETQAEKQLAQEVAAKMHAPAPKPTVVETPKPEPKPEPVHVEQKPAPTPAPVQKPTPEPVKEPSRVEAKPDKVIEPEPLTDAESDEDDILQFIPTHQTPKPAPAKPAQPVQPKPEQPAKPVQQAPVKPTQPEKTAQLAQSTPSFSQAAQNTRSLNDLFNERKEDHSLGTQFQHAKVKDLTKAISINDKFTYIKELFNNHGEEFSAVIQRLNQCTNIEEAFDLLEEFKKRYYWDSTSTAYLSLCDLIRRKYA